MDPTALTGRDTFVISSGDDKDVIGDFEADKDKVDISDVMDIDDFDDLLNNHLFDLSGEAAIDTDNGFTGVNTILFVGYTVDDFGFGEAIDQSNFVFV